MIGVIFDNVKVIDPKKYNYYRCEGVSNALATGGTFPVPFCFNKSIK